MEVTWTVRILEMKKSCSPFDLSGSAAASRPEVNLKPNSGASGIKVTEINFLTTLMPKILHKCDFTEHSTRVAAVKSAGSKSLATLSQ